jgi:hypothetical protein
MLSHPVMNPGDPRACLEQASAETKNCGNDQTEARWRRVTETTGMSKWKKFKGGKVEK